MENKFFYQMLLALISWACISELYCYELVVNAGNPGAMHLVEANTSSQLRPTTGNIEERYASNISIVGDQFMLNGKPLQIVSGSVHYFRMPHQYWRDRIRKLKAAGFNAIATYVEWSYHEPEYRQYRFSGDYDVFEFVRIAAEEGLLVLLRPGPYICAERDLGGLPYWLLHRYPHIQLRTTDKDFIAETRIWMQKLFEGMTPLLFDNGGPIILVQVENEYGSYSSDMQYKIQIRDIIKEHVGSKALLYTTDGTYLNMIKNGAVPGVLTTIDFGVVEHDKVTAMFSHLREFMRSGPLMNSEFYPGWLTHWGELLQQVDKDSVVDTLEVMLKNKISVNVYVFYGGTNFEFSSGANYVDKYMPDITSYDYDAPLSEAGDPTPKYYAIRELMERLFPAIQRVKQPAPSPKGKYGNVSLLPQVNLLSSDGRSLLGKSYDSVTGLLLPTFERLQQRAGLMLYETKFNSSGADVLHIKKFHDRVYIYVDGDLKDILSRASKRHTSMISAKKNSVLSLLVESQGRINYGSRLHDFKGILSGVEWGDDVLDGKWSVTGYPLEDVSNIIPTQSDNSTTRGPVFYKGLFTLPEGESPLDTFLDTTGWGKGYVWVNGHNLGRYWPDVGPQVTLYVPGVWLHAAPHTNTILVLELQFRTSSDFQMTFIDYPILNRTDSSGKMADREALIVHV